MLVLHDSFQPRELYSPWNSPDKNTRVGSLSFLQGSSQPGIKPKSPALQVDSLPADPQGKPKIAYPISSGPSWPKNRTRISCIAGGFFTNWAFREASYLQRLFGQFTFTSSRGSDVDISSEGSALQPLQSVQGQKTRNGARQSHACLLCDVEGLPWFPSPSGDTESHLEFWCVICQSGPWTGPQCPQVLGRLQGPWSALLFWSFCSLCQVKTSPGLCLLDRQWHPGWKLRLRTNRMRLSYKRDVRPGSGSSLRSWRHPSF